MVDVEKQIAHWREGAVEDLEAARSLMEKAHFRHALFFAHLAVEKILKAHVVRLTGEIPPKIHVLPRLAELAKLNLTDPQKTFIARFDRYQITARYPDSPAPPIEPIRAQQVMQSAEEVFGWLTERL